MPSRRVNVKPFIREIENTLRILADEGIALYVNGLSIRETNTSITLSSPNHKPGEIHRSGPFNSICQYLEIIKQQNYSCILEDGSLFSMFYVFSGFTGEIERSSLLWWPSPYCCSKEDFSQFNVDELVELYLSENGSYKYLRMRTPLRFDFDPSNQTAEHPSSHLHFQDQDCRVYVDRPICFNKFIKFVFRNFYHDTYRKFFFWQDLAEFDFRFSAQVPLESNLPFITWSR